jgi:hypothetical protein
VSNTSRSRDFTIITITTLMVVGIYVASYLGLSLRGSYMPFTYGTNGIKDWAWTPRFFADDAGKYRLVPRYAFMPLYWLDSRYWHNDWTGMTGPRKMPVWNKTN